MHEKDAEYATGEIQCEGHVSPIIVEHSLVRWCYLYKARAAIQIFSSLGF